MDAEDSAKPRPSHRERRQRSKAGLAAAVEGHRDFRLQVSVLKKQIVGCRPCSVTGLVDDQTPEDQGPQAKLQCLCVESRIAPRIVAIAPCLLAQEEAGSNEQYARTSAGLVPPDTNVRCSGSKHFGHNFENFTAAGIRRAQKQYRSGESSSAVPSNASLIVNASPRV